MKILVTAGGGLVGSNLIETLVKQGHQVAGIDARPLPPGATQIDGRTAEADLLAEADGFDVIYHLEWRGSFKQAVTDPMGTESYNLANIHKVMQVASTTGAKVVFASTGIVYGGNLNRPTKEDEDLNPRSFYGAQKRHAEQLVRIYATQYKVQAVSARIFNVYGPGATDPNQIIPRLLEAIKNKNPIKLTGDGQQTRDFIQVEDVAAGLASLINLQEWAGQALNLGSGIGTTMESLAHTVYDAAGLTANIEYVPAVPGESRTLIADMTATEQSAGFKPKIGIQEGIRHLLGKEI